MSTAFDTKIIKTSLVESQCSMAVAARAKLQHWHSLYRVYKK